MVELNLIVNLIVNGFGKSFIFILFLYGGKDVLIKDFLGFWINKFKFLG